MVNLGQHSQHQGLITDTTFQKTFKNKKAVKIKQVIRPVRKRQQDSKLGVL